jgi:hypothetical protein
LQLAFLANRGDPPFKIVRVHIESRRINIDKNRRATCQQNSIGGGVVSERRHENGIALADAARQQRNNQRRCSACARRNRFGAGPRRERFF